MFPVLRKRFYAGGRTRNLLKNSACAQLVAGTPGTLPKSWSSFFPDVSNGITTQVVGAAQESGMDCIDFRVSGTPTGGGGTVGVRSTATITQGMRVNTVVGLPAGTTSGDLLLLLIEIDQATSAPTITTPDGTWTHVQLGTYTSGDPWQQIWHAYWKVPGGSEPSTYTFTHGNANTEGIIYCLTGANLTTPLSPTPTFSGTSNTGSTCPVPTITTSANNARLIAWASGWNSTASASGPTGSTPTYAGRLTGTFNYFADGVLATAGATGAKTVTLPNNATGGSQQNFGIHVAVEPATGGAFGSSQIFFAGTAEIPGVNGDATTESVYCRLIAGSIPTSIQLQINQNDASGSFLANTNTSITPVATMQRFSQTAKSAQPSMAFWQPGLIFNYSTTLDVTLRISLPQFERGIVATPAQKRLAA